MKRKHYIIEGEGEGLVYYQVTRGSLIQLAREGAERGYECLFLRPTLRVPAGVRVDEGRAKRAKPGVDIVRVEHLTDVIGFWVQWAVGAARFKKMVDGGRLARIMADFAGRHSPRDRGEGDGVRGE